MHQLRKSSLTRRDFLYSSGMGVAASMLGPALGRSRANARPNFLWISAEDLSPDLGCYGDRYARTPNIDKFSKESALFTRAFTVAGVCAPSRSGIITGMYPCSIGTGHMRSQGVPPPYVKCFTEYLRGAGYYCTNNAKTDYNFDSPDTAWDESSARAHWRNRAQSQPFFAVFNINTTHESRIRIDDQQFNQLTAPLRPEDRHDPTKAELPPYYPDTPLVRRDWARYYDLGTAMDLQVAEILQQLEDDGLAENTVVFFWGDHGRGLPRAKRWIYDSGIHAPLIIRWPGKIAPGGRNDQLVSFIDFAPTLLSIAGIDVPSHFQGQAFLGAAAAEPRRHIFAARDRMDEAYDIIRCVRDQRYKYIRNFEPEKTYAQRISYMDEMPTMQEMRRLHAEGKLSGPEELFFRQTKPAEELYDTAADPHEINSLAESPQHQEILLEMRRVLQNWMDEIDDLALIPEDQLLERMRPGGKWERTAEPRLSPGGGAFDAALEVKITCPTEGASIAYTTDAGENPHWRFYAGGLRVSGNSTLRVKACRLGYKDSSEVTAAFEVTG
ncbi:MAG: sulfatase-like hydrolase/transferase [Acidobacteriota bacterium]